MITRKSRRNDTRAFLLSSNGNSNGNSRCYCNTSGRGLNLTRSKGLNVAGEQRRRSIRRDRTRVITEFRRHSAAGRFDLLLFTKSLCSCSTAAEHGKRAGFSARWLRYQKTVGKKARKILFIPGISRIIIGISFAPTHDDSLHQFNHRK